MSSLDTIINVTITRETKVPSRAGFGDGAFVSNDAVFSERIQVYSSLTEVQQDPLTGDDSVAYATRYFGQEQSPERLYLIKKGRDLAHVQVITFDAEFVTGNAIDLDVDAAAVGPVAFNIDSDTTLGDVATAIAAEAGVASAVIDTALNTITVTGATVNVAVLLENLVVSGGATQAGGTIATTQYQDALDTIVNSISDAQLANDDWYALSIYSRVEADVLAVAAVIEAQTKLFFMANDDADGLTSLTTDIFSQLKALNYDRTVMQYSESADATTADPFAEAAFQGGQLPDDPGSITWAFKSMAGVAADNLSSTAENNLLGKNVNVYVEVGGLPITKDGTVASGEYIDVIRGSDFIQVRMQEEIFFLLANSKKVPYTNDGIALIQNKMEQVLTLSTNQGILSADPAYEVSAPDANEVSLVDKGNRLLPDMDFQATLAGAIHKTQIQGRLVL